MTEPAIPQEPEQIRSRMIWIIAAATVAVSGLLVAVAWVLVVPPPAYRAVPPSPLQREVFERAGAGAAADAAGARRLERTEWVDRRARIVRIPIDRAIDAVVIDPQLIGASPPANSPTTTTVGTTARAGQVRR